MQFHKTQQKARLFDDVYYAAGRWDAPRRLVMKADWLPKGANPRFVLTNLELPPQALYDEFYVQRGADSEHRIKELKLGIAADRLSCYTFVANQFRLLLSQAAYVLLLSVRRAAVGTEFATRPSGTVALDAGQRSRQSARVGSSHPGRIGGLLSVRL